MDGVEAVNELLNIGMDVTELPTNLPGMGTPVDLGTRGFQIVYPAGSKQEDEIAAHGRGMNYDKLREKHGAVRLGGIEEKKE